jgi:hypothetical protein
MNEQETNDMIGDYEDKEALKNILIASGLVIATIGFSYFCGRAVGFEKGLAKGTIATDRLFQKFVAPEAYQAAVKSANEFMRNATRSELLALSKAVFK